MVIFAADIEMRVIMITSKQPIPRQMGCVSLGFLGRSRRLAAVVYLVISHLSGFYPCCIFNRLHDFVISRTPAKIPCNCLLDFITRWIRFFFQQFCSGHDKAWRAITTLHRAILNESLLNGMKFIAVCQPFYSYDFCTVCARCRDKTGHYRHAIEENSACAAFAFSAAFFCAGKSTLFTQET